MSGRSEVPLNHIDLLPQVKVTSEVDRGSAKLRNGITHFNTATVEENILQSITLREKMKTV